MHSSPRVFFGMLIVERFASNTLASDRHKQYRVYTRRAHERNAWMLKSELDDSALVLVSAALITEIAATAHDNYYHCLYVS